MSESPWNDTWVLLDTTNMTEYLLRRVLATIPILFGVALLTFLLLQLMPGDPAVVMAGERATPEIIESIREDLGLNDPIWVQFGRYLFNAFQLDFGRSLLTERPVIQEIGERLPATIELTLCALLIGITVGISMGTLAAWYKHSWVDTVCMVVALAGVSLSLIHI